MNYEDRVTKAAVEAAIAGAGKVAIGHYTGSGRYGEENPSRLSCSFKPKAMILTGIGGPSQQPVKVIVIKPETKGYTEGVDHITVTWEENGVSWYNANSAARQMNTVYVSFQYVLLG